MTECIGMDDAQIVQRIEELVSEEHRLESVHPGHQLSQDEVERQRQLEVALDQCWDLLRQRRARREAGLDPDEASARSEQVVEHYQQ